jgi:hypothetical protein
MTTTSTINNLYHRIIVSPLRKQDLLVNYEKWELPAKYGMYFLNTTKLFYLAKVSPHAPLNVALAMAALRQDLHSQVKHMTNQLVKRSLLYGGCVHKAKSLVGSATTTSPNIFLLQKAVLDTFARDGEKNEFDTTDMTLLSLEWMMSVQQYAFIDGIDNVKKALEMIPPHIKALDIDGVKTQGEYLIAMQNFISKYLYQRFQVDIMPLAWRLGEAVVFMEQHFSRMSGDFTANAELLKAAKDYYVHDLQNMHAAAAAMMAMIPPYNPLAVPAIHQRRVA